jgi:hypothetical protein
MSCATPTRQNFTCGTFVDNAFKKEANPEGSAIWSNSSTTMRIPSEAIFCSTIAATALVNTVSIVCELMAGSVVVSDFLSPLRPTSAPSTLTPNFGLYSELF